MDELFARSNQEPLVRGVTMIDCATESVTTSASVSIRLAFIGRRQEIVSGTEHRNQQKVEVGERRGPLG